MSWAVVSLLEEEEEEGLEGSKRPVQPSMGSTTGKGWSGSTKEMCRMGAVSMMLWMVAKSYVPVFFALVFVGGLRETGEGMEVVEGVSFWSLSSKEGGRVIQKQGKR